MTEYRPASGISATRATSIPSSLHFSVYLTEQRLTAIGQQLTDALLSALRQGPTENYYIGSCESIQQAASNVTGVLQTILIQATMKSALDNKSARSARGYILTTALMPILLKIDEVAAKVIEKNMIYSDNLGSDSDAVWSAFTAIIPKMTGVSCSLIGSVPEKRSLCSATSAA